MCYQALHKFTGQISQNQINRAIIYKHDQFCDVRQLVESKPLIRNFHYVRDA